MKGHSGAVGVFVRIRPTVDFAQGLIECLPDGQTVNIHHRKDSRKFQDSNKGRLSSWSFRLGGVLQDVSQEDVYARVCQQVVLGALDGYNGTVMCFGQTGAGKTYTMTGSTKSYKHRGIIPRALQEIFQEVEKRTEHSFSMHLSYLEIYNETLLEDSPHLSPRGMVVMEEPGRGVFIRGLSLHPVHSEEEALNLLFEGEMNRIIGSHTLNRNSSRSHCIFTLHIESHSRTLSDAKYITSKLSLVDLAGSERLGKTGLSTLRFAGRMKRVQTDPAINENMDPAIQIRKLEREVQMLKEELSMYNTLARRPSVTYEPLSEAQQAEINNQVRRYLDGSLKEISIVSVRHVRAIFAQFKLAVQEQEQKVKAQLCQTYNLLEKDQSTKTSAIKEWDTRSSTEDVGGCSFGVSAQSQNQTQRPTSTKSKMKKSRDKRSQSRRQGEGSPVSRRNLESSSKTKLSSGQTPEREVESREPDTESKDTQESQPPGNEPFHSESPSHKAEAFEDFKLGQGSKINCIFKENKAVLLERRNLLRQLTEEVNMVKREIDSTAAIVQQHKQMGETQGQYLVMEEEPDADLLLQLRALKAVYRQRYEALRDIKAEVSYCQHLVDQCRVRLLSEFETWYQKTSLVSEEEVDISAFKIPSQREDDQQSELLTDSPRAESFYTARCRMLKRRKVMQNEHVDRCSFEVC